MMQRPKTCAQAEPMNLCLQRGKIQEQKKGLSSEIMNYSRPVTEGVYLDTQRTERGHPGPPAQQAECAGGLHSRYDSPFGARAMITDAQLMT